LGQVADSELVLLENEIPRWSGEMRLHHPDEVIPILGMKTENFG